MKIAIDATILRNDRITGVERYIIELIRSLKNISHDHVVYVLLNKAYTDFDNLIGYGIPIWAPVNNRVYNDQIWIPYIASRLKIDLMHFPVFGAPIFYRGKFVMTIHDLTFWLYPNTISKGAKFYYKPLFKQAVSRASHLLTVSHSSKQGIKDIFNISDNQITVTYEALSTDYVEAFNSNNIPVENIGKGIAKHSYILSVGTVEPRKNLETLIKAFAILKSKFKLPYQLVLTGRAGWQTSLDFPKEIESDIIRTGYVNDSELASLYKNSILYIFPSLYEGFGFPLLEALYAELPVIASKSSSLPEIGGDVCIYVDNPSSAEEFAYKINSILQRTDLDHQKIERKKRAESFSWDLCASTTIKVYEAVLYQKL